MVSIQCVVDLYQNIGAVFRELAAEEEVHEVDLSDDVDQVEELAEEELHRVELQIKIKLMDEVENFQIVSSSGICSIKKITLNN